jgi:hypothetical protein
MEFEQRDVVLIVTYSRTPRVKRGGWGPASAKFHLDPRDHSLHSKIGLAEDDSHRTLSLRSCSDSGGHLERHRAIVCCHGTVKAQNSP